MNEREMIFSEQSLVALDISIQVVTVVAMLPLYILLVSQIRVSQKHVSRQFKLGSLLVTVVALLALSPAIQKISQVFIPNKQYSLFITTLAILIIDLDIIAITVTFVFLQWKIQKPYFWLLIGSGWIFKIVADALKGYFLASEMYIIGSFPDYMFNISYALLLTGLITIFERYEKPISVSEIDQERRQYQSLYEDMNVFAKDLVTVTSLLRHDLLNDLVVIQSGIDLYQETGKKDFLERVINRTTTVAERLDSLKSESMLLESLAIQPIELDFVSNITDSFENTEIVSFPQDVKVNANRLLYPVIFNVIQNAFQHAGKDVKVIIEAVQENSDVMIQIKDDGKGISEEEKKLIFQQGYRGTGKGVSGMGLYLVKMVLESFGGSISVSDNEPKGSIFTIKLAIAKS
ncbi:MAG: sensor histidine kinase [Candidatus Heimdallarchaeota archaeon]|nr:sensor histidine kinase [Candidatus Heimdallarchaeota archaeon]